MTTTTKTAVRALNDYFNEGDGKVGMKAFAEELRALSPDEKQYLAQGACDVMGWTLVEK